MFRNSIDKVTSSLGNFKKLRRGHAKFLEKPILLFLTVTKYCNLFLLANTQHPFLVLPTPFVYLSAAVRLPAIIPPKNMRYSESRCCGTMLGIRWVGWWTNTTRTQNAAPWTKKNNRKKNGEERVYFSIFWQVKYHNICLSFLHIHINYYIYPPFLFVWFFCSVIFSLCRFYFICWIKKSKQMYKSCYFDRS